MINFIMEALRKYRLTSAVIVIDPKENNFETETCDGNLIMQINKAMNLEDVLELCGTDIDLAADQIGEYLATKMCDIIQNGMGGLVTVLDLNHINSGEIEKHINSQRKVMLDSITNDFIRSVRDMQAMRNGEEI